VGITAAADKMLKRRRRWSRRDFANESSFGYQPVESQQIFISVNRRSFHTANSPQPLIIVFAVVRRLGRLSSDRVLNLGPNNTGIGNIGNTNTGLLNIGTLNTGAANLGNFHSGILGLGG
jgi:Pentapeptide repeats (8 copies)